MTNTATAAWEDRLKDRDFR